MSEPVLRGFSGDVAQNYARFRRGYPSPVVDALAEAFALDRTDVVVDLGCGTGQLTLPLAGRVRAAVGVDPEPDMLRLAGTAARHAGVRNASWMVGFDSDLPALGALLGPGTVAAVTAAVAIHWMDQAALFAAARPLLRRGGGVAVVTNGAPLWLQDSDWSRTLRGVLEAWTARDVGWACGTDEGSRAGYRDAMAAAGYTTGETRVEYEAELDLDGIIGGMFSAMSAVDVSDPYRRNDFEARVRAALAPRTRFVEHVTVVVQTGTLG
ncbi:class I SAM-dependent methyltransferase [Virgisporangium ochraceum]|uniref:Methyltransferase n=1 Tax=Virgisporangium ochraceum TaxID=65505 RepID=A0A8J3ZUA1_9ACTN|nr:methyltransferase domain-containing protein [Virgisporangium ochraceum]GIJ69112.1 methyltransferase [Virgisporangium ochraceum]